MEMSNTNPGYPPSSSVNNPAVANSIDPNKDANAAPAKRRPGRPKGSTNKKRDGEPELPKVKRPVGRPRKDGFPAGSVGPSRPAKQPRLSSGSTWSTTGFTGVPYPSAPAFATVSAPNGLQAVPPGAQALIDPSLRADATNPVEWTHLYRTDPSTFLSSLLASLAAPNPVSTTGPSVEEAFKSHLGSLSNSSNASSSQANQPNTIPSLYYVLKTFWLPSSPSYFSLTASASTARTPSEHRFLYWDPLPLVFNGIACPSCAQPLINKGRISSGPIKIYDLEKPFFIIGCEYICNSPQCISSSSTSTAGTGRRYSSTDSSIFRSLPQRLKDEFPAKLIYEAQDVGPDPNMWNWTAVGVSRPLWNLVRGCLRMEMSKESIIGIIMAIQHGGSVIGGGGVMGAPIVLAAGPVEDKVDHSAYQHHQARGHVTVDIDEDEMDAENAEDQLVDDQDDHDGQQGPPNGAPAPEFIQRFLEVYSHTSSAPATQPPSSHTVSVATTPAMQLTPSPHITPLPQPPPHPHPQAHQQPQPQPQVAVPVPVPIPVQVPTVQVQAHAAPPQASAFQQQQPQQPQHQQQQQPGPATQVYDYARPFGNYQYAAYAFFPPTNATVAAATSGGSPSLQAAGLGDGQAHNPLKRAYPFGDPSSARGGASNAPQMAAEPHLLTSPQSSHTTTPSPNIRHQTHPHMQGQAQIQAVPQVATASSSSSTGGKFRNPRHCSKCGKADCKGKGGRAFCTNGCQDCGKLDCRGRNNRKPEKKCDGWTG